MDYFLKASAIIILFYACYKLFLQRDTFFQANRWFLLIGLFIAIVLPLVIIPIYIEYTPRPIQFFETSAITFPTQQTTQAPPFDYWQLLPFIYLAGVLFVTTKVTLQFVSLNRLLKNQKKTKTEQFTFIETESNIAPFSFFNRIVFNSNQFTKNELEHIITHEKVHAKQLHSIDILLTQIATILFWFNPCIWLYTKAMQQNLEFIADHEAQNTIACSKSYQTVLLKASLTTNQLAITNNFYQSLIKKRIVMLQKSQSKKSNQLKFTIVLPFLALFLMSFNIKEVYIAKAETNKSTIVKTETFTITTKSSDTEIEAIKNRLETLTNDLKIKFSDINRNSDGEIINLSIETQSKNKNNFTKHITYNHKDKSPIGNLILKVKNNELHFGYEKFGMNMKVTKEGTTTVLTEQLYSKKETQNVGTVHLQNTRDSVNIVLDSDNNEDSDFSYKIETEAIGDDKSKLIITENGKKPLYVIDGKIVEGNNINYDTENIASINVLKGKSAEETFGELGKNGVIVITSKKHFENDSESKTYNFTPIVDSVNPKKAILKYPNEDSNASQTSYSNSVFNDSTIIIIDGKKVDNGELKKLNPDNIKSMTVLKDKTAKQVYEVYSAYDTKNVNRIIEITTKEKNTSKEIIIKNNDSIKKDSPWKISNIEVSGTFYTDDEDHLKNGSTLNISENTPELVLNQHKAYLQTQGIELKYLTINRNNKDKITKLKLSVVDKKGKKSKFTYQANKGISPVKISLDGVGNIDVTSE
ncbi:M56 family metallopeptidase [Olleya namhaensis]|uniref:Signal transducer regulating beta-lactamase production, contains metallopeptidase domain n=1 Tax=Olleya namhaensis TaxID=1144750 RepID=A0A1I3PUG9_9FLAO|nr:M56 family metallopeptidase [Olleya namhaensis]SFJ25288.1 Signal transducer regulating beta-lactamase production, contains metallopeptidase domain [Olleya namhaensis]